MAQVHLAAREDGASKGDTMAGTTVRLSGVAVWVRDVERSARFYVEALGCVERLRTGDRIIVAGAGQASSLMLAPAPADHDPARLAAGLMKLVWETDDAAASYRDALAAGASAVEEPRLRTEAPYVIGFVRDPDGYLIELIQPAP